MAEASLSNAMGCLRRFLGQRRLVGATPDAIGALEREIGFPLAPEVREWLSLCAGVQIGVFTLMGTNRRHGLVGILDALAPEWRTLQWCPVATDGCGNFYCVIRDTRTSTNPVVFVEATGPVVVQYVVASSFAYFLWFCLTDVGRILDGVSEGSWPFDANFVLNRDPDLRRLSHLPLPWSEEI